MRKILIMSLLLGNYAFAQVEKVKITSKSQEPKQVLKMISRSGSEDADLLEIMHFEKINFYQVRFSGVELKNKHFAIVAMEIWNGKIRKTNKVIDSRNLVGTGFEKIPDTIFDLKILGKMTNTGKLKISFVFPRFSVTAAYKARRTDDYSLRNLAEESHLPLEMGKNIHFMAFILPYNRHDGTKSWCQVGSSGADVENWGKKYGIKHYIIYDLCFDN